MKKELTPEQIKILYAFVEGNYVKYYDLQIELVDHLATEIEQKWAENPSLPFEETLSNVYAEFGILGFRETVQKAHIMMMRKYQKMWWSYFKQFWKLPKIIFSLVLFGFVWLCFITFGYKMVMYCNVGLLTAQMLYSFYQSVSHLFKKVQLLSTHSMDNNTHVPTHFLSIWAFFSYLHCPPFWAYECFYSSSLDNEMGYL